MKVRKGQRFRPKSGVDFQFELENRCATWYINYLKNGKIVEVDEECDYDHTLVYILFLESAAKMERGLVSIENHLLKYWEPAPEQNNIGTDDLINFL